MANTNTGLVKDTANKKIIVTRKFEASAADVWRAWTEADLLDQWWAPNPWRAETKHMDFHEGGHWLYAMVGPNGERHWARINYLTIDPFKSFTVEDSFCDEHGTPNTEAPSMRWKNEFREISEGTEVVIEVNFRTEEDLQKILDMGFEEGFLMALGNLDRYLATRFKMRREMKRDHKPRVTSYLNFPGNTDEAMHFYKKVFGGEFTGRGLVRFADIEMPAEYPPMKEADKKLIIHAELSILGGHVLMATDAPESMGFKMVHGNNMHICLEPESREETKRLFDALSAGGNVTMPLADMFWGAYFAEFTDRYGINWMLNYQEKEAKV